MSDDKQPEKAIFAEVHAPITCPKCRQEMSYTEKKDIAWCRNVKCEIGGRQFLVTPPKAWLFPIENH